ncbi:MAG: sigma-54 interaction domain-containing protein [Phycisphaerae bacterium]
MIQRAGDCGGYSGGGRTLTRLVGGDARMRVLRRRIAAVAHRDGTVLLCGESGTGKELVARHIHAAGPRANGPFVVADCTTLPETLIASHLFGHVRGAFTDAKQSTLGLFRAAHSGTLLIDEIGEMPLCAQAKLLRCIQERSVVPVGGVNPIDVDVRIIAATHRDLESMVANNAFRADLYYRLDVIRLDVPSLRNHRRDIELLANHFLEEQYLLGHTGASTFSPEALTALQGYAWPGNVRELANVIEHATTFAEGEQLTLADLPEKCRQTAMTPPLDTPCDDPAIPPLQVVERRLLQRALQATSGNQSKAAQLVGVERHRFARMVRRHGLRPLIDSFHTAAGPPPAAIAEEGPREEPALSDE